MKKLGRNSKKRIKIHESVVEEMNIKYIRE